MPSLLLVWGLLLGVGTAQAQGTVHLDPQIQELVSAISEENLEHLVTTLAAFEPRHTLSSTENYARRHTVEDTPDGVHFPYLTRRAG